MGRTDELSVLLKSLSNAAEGRGSVMMVGGEAGIGKTRITEEVMSSAHLSGFKIFLGRCLPESPYAYLPFRQAFQRPLASSRVGGAASTRNLIATYDSLDRTDPHSAYSDDSSLRDTIHYSTLAFLKQQSAEEPVLLILEDMQWSDGASLQLFRFLARNIRNSKVSILGNYRSEDVLPVEGKGPHPLNEVLQAMRSEGIVTEIILGPLDEESIKKAIEGHLGGALDLSVGSRIFTESEGNPLFALETAFLLTNMGNLIDVGGVWRPVDELNLQIPPTVREVILRRLDHVPSDARRVLEAASVIGITFSPETLLDVMSIDRMALMDALGALDLQHHLVKSEGGRYYFRHEKILAITYGSISNLRRRELHARIGMSLEAQGGSDSLPGILSHHYYHARVWNKCLANSLLAGEGLLKRFAANDALPYYLRAKEALETDSTLEGERLKVLEGLADAYQETLDFVQADELYVQVFPLAQDGNTRARILRKRMWCWDHDRLGNGSLEMQKRLIDEGLAIPDIDPLEKAEILSCLSSSTLHGGDADKAKEISEQAIAIYRQTRSMPRLAWELVYCGYIALSQMRFDEALGRLSEAREILREHPWSMAENDADQHYGRIMVYQGRYDEAVEVFKKSLEKSLQLGEYRIAGIACYYLALVYEELSDLEKMETWVNIGLKHASQGGYRPQMAMLELLLAHAAVVKCDVTSADRLLEAAKDLYSEVDPSIRNFATGMMQVVEGEAHYIAGFVEESVRFVESGLAELRVVPNGEFYEAIARRWYGDLLQNTGRPFEARHQYSIALSIYQKLSNVTMVERLKQRES